MKERVAPDAQALERVLAREEGAASIGGAIIHLAWKLGLTTQEIQRLQWPDVSFEAQEVLLPHRTVPMEAATKTYLLALRRAAGKRSSYVVPAGRGNGEATRQHITRQVRQALDQEPSLRDVTLTHLRQDFVIRQLQTHNWPYVAKISGIAATSMYAKYSAYMQNDRVGNRRACDPAGDERDMELVLQKAGDSGEGLVLWLVWKHGLLLSEAIDLTWSDVDLVNGTLFLPDGRSISLQKPLWLLLMQVKANRKPGADPHVALTPESGKPYKITRISKAIRNCAIRAGCENLLPLDFYQAGKRMREDTVILETMQKNGSITTREVEELLQLRHYPAYQRMRRLTEEGKLIHIGNAYYPVGSVVPPEEHRTVLCAYLETHDFLTRQVAAELLGLPPVPCATILSRLVQEGVLKRDGHQYQLALPANTPKSM